MLPSKNNNVSHEASDVPVDLKSHLRCSRCTTIPLGEPLYTCYLGHITCNTCRGTILSNAPTRQEMESEYEYSWRIRGVCLCGLCGGVTKLSNYMISKNTLTLEDNGPSENLTGNPPNTPEFAVPNASEYIQQSESLEHQHLNNTLLRSLWTTSQSDNSSDGGPNIMTNAQPQVACKQNPLCTQVILTPQQLSALTSIKRSQGPQYGSYLTIGDQLSNSICCVGVPHTHVKTSPEIVIKDNITLKKHLVHDNQEMLHHTTEGSLGKCVTCPDMNNTPSNKPDDGKLRMPAVTKITYFNTNPANCTERIMVDNHTRNIPHTFSQDHSKITTCNNLERQYHKPSQIADHEYRTNSQNTTSHTQYTICTGINVNRNHMDHSPVHSDGQLSSNESRTSGTTPNYMATLFKEEQRISQLILEKKQKMCEFEEQSDYKNQRNESLMSVSRSACDPNWSLNECEERDYTTPGSIPEINYHKSNMPKNELHYKQLSSLVATNTNTLPKKLGSKINGKQNQDNPSGKEKATRGEKLGKSNGESKNGSGSVANSERNSSGRHSEILSDVMMMNTGGASMSHDAPRVATNIQTTVSYCDHKRKASRQVIILNSSHRPILCPNTTCGQSVSPFGLASHMAFMHQSVPLLDVEPGVPMHVWIKADQIPYNEATCILLVLLAGRMRGPSGRGSIGQPRLHRYRDRLALPLMVARLTVSVELGRTSETDDAVLVWLADVDSGAVVYTAGVTDRLSRSKSFTFRLPAYSLRSSQLPADVYQQGDCIVVSSAMLNEFCKSNGGFDIFLLVHSMDTTHSQTKTEQVL